jgi:hypothetical protein
VKRMPKIISFEPSAAGACRGSVQRRLLKCHFSPMTYEHAKRLVLCGIGLQTSLAGRTLLGTRP